MEVVDIELLKALLNRESYVEFKDHLKTYMVTEVAWGLVGDIGKYYDEHPAIGLLTESAFATWFRVAAHPSWTTEKHKVYTSIFNNLFDGKPVDKTIATSLLKARLHTLLKKAAEEGKDEDITEIIKDLNDLTIHDDPTSKIITTPIADILTSASRLVGIEWRVEDLNRSVGPVGPGDFILVGKRPETGGTSFMLSELTYWLHQLPENKGVLIINNEEASPRVVTRAVSSALGRRASDLFSDPSKADKDYNDFLGTRVCNIVSEPDTTTWDIEALLKTGKYGALGINVIEKVKGLSGKLEDFQRLERLGAWAREMAVKYELPVMGIVQADVSAEGVKFPDQNALYKSKTGLQGEADVLIMIGKSNDDSDPKDIRYLHVAKNKLPGGPRTEPHLRHIKSEVKFDIETGRYTAVNTKWK